MINAGMCPAWGYAIFPKEPTPMRKLALLCCLAFVACDGGVDADKVLGGDELAPEAPLGQLTKAASANCKKSIHVLMHAWSGYTSLIGGGANPSSCWYGLTADDSHLVASHDVMLAGHWRFCPKNAN